MKYASHINKKGMAYLKQELAELNLDWDVEAVADEIEMTDSFMELREGENVWIESRHKYRDGGNHFWFLTSDMVAFRDVPDV